MPATKEPSRFEGRAVAPSLRDSHLLILNNVERILRTKRDTSFMPIFEYICQECEHAFEALVYGQEKARCPKCQSKKLAPQLSTFAVSTKGSGPSAPGTTPCGSCGDLGGPGACSRRDFN